MYCIRLEFCVVVVLLAKYFYKQFVKLQGKHLKIYMIVVSHLQVILESVVLFTFLLYLLVTKQSFCYSLSK